jgi:hypothetical protein
MANFAALKTEVQTLLIDAPTAVSSLTGTWVNRAIRKLQQKHNFKAMETEVAFTTVVDTRSLGARPADWKEARRKPYYIEDLGTIRELIYVDDKSQALAAFGDDTDYDFGSPRALFEDEEAAAFLIFPYPDALSDYSDGEYRLVLPYWQYLDALVGDEETNWFTSNAEQYIVYQAVAEGFYANEDEDRALIWERRAMSQYADVLLQDKRRRLANTDTFAYHTGARMPQTQE